MIAAEKGSIQAANLLIELGADVKIRQNEGKGSHALLIAAENNQPRIVEMLLAKEPPMVNFTCDGKFKIIRVLFY
jgi:ankyrin repeat protein